MAKRRRRRTREDGKDVLQIFAISVGENYGAIEHRCCATKRGNATSINSLKSERERGREREKEREKKSQRERKRRDPASPDSHSETSLSSHSPRRNQHVSLRQKYTGKIMSLMRLDISPRRGNAFSLRQRDTADSCRYRRYLGVTRASLFFDFEESLRYSNRHMIVHISCLPRHFSAWMESCRKSLFCSIFCTIQWTWLAM